MTNSSDFSQANSSLTQPRGNQPNLSGHYNKNNQEGLPGWGLTGKRLRLRGASRGPSRGNDLKVKACEECRTALNTNVRKNNFQTEELAFRILTPVILQSRWQQPSNHASG